MQVWPEQSEAGRAAGEKEAQGGSSERDLWVFSRVATAGIKQGRTKWFIRSLS